MTSPARAVIGASSSVGCRRCRLEVWRLAVNTKMSIGIFLDCKSLREDRRGSGVKEE